MQKGWLLAQEQELGSLNISPGYQKSFAALQKLKNVKSECYFTGHICHCALKYTNKNL